MSAFLQPQTKAASKPSFTPVPSGLLQRKCACGGGAGLDGMCEECRDKRLQRRTANGADPTTVPPIVHEVLRSSDQRRDETMHTFMPPRFEHDFSKISVYPATPQAVQPKLKINQPGDMYEQEADHMAEIVMRMPDYAAQGISNSPLKIQRKCPACESGGGTCPRCEEQKIQTKLLASQITPLVQRQPPLGEEIDENIQAKGMPGNAPTVTPQIAANINALRGGGQPLPETARRFFEPRFGHDFSQIRIHTSPQAGEDARLLNAKAFTLGRDIVFGTGQYITESIDGTKLLAHELTHVVQQFRAERPPGESTIQRACLKESECKKPEGEAQEGSATAFAKEVGQQEAPKREQRLKQKPEAARSGRHGRPAVEIEKLFKEFLPNLRSSIHGVFVDEDLPEIAAAYAANCELWKNKYLPPGTNAPELENASYDCIFVQKELEQQAAAYNRGENPALAQKATRQDWLNWAILRQLTHEVTHTRFKKVNPPFPSNTETCTNENLETELSEIAAKVSEFPIVNRMGPDRVEYWFDNILKVSNGDSGKTAHQSLTVASREIACNCECASANALIRAAFDFASSSWKENEKLEFHDHMKRGKGAEYGVYWPFELPPRIGRVGRHELSVLGGGAFSGSKQFWVTMLTYRYVLWHMSKGRLRLDIGAHANLASLWEQIPRGEFGAGTIGLQFISTPRSVERKFGGITGRIDTGLGVGQFLLKPVALETPTTSQETDFILQVGAGAQFFIPKLTSLTPVTLEATYRLAQPLDANAERIHTFGLMVSYQR